tara:strand:- start:123 stop:377 length:255 start_codon:yes stop_codon:yes gene_type:complete
MIEIIECTNKQKPSHVVLNNLLPRNHKGYTTKTEAKEEAIIKAVLWGSENIKLVKFEDLENPILVDETINGGGDVRCDNTNKIL